MPNYNRKKENVQAVKTKKRKKNRSNIARYLVKYLLDKKTLFFS